MPALMRAVVATSVKVSPWFSRTRRATAPSCLPTVGTLLVAPGAAGDVEFLENRATMTPIELRAASSRRFHALCPQFTLHAISLHYSN